MRVLFSGRFDPIHVGHWSSALKLLKIFGEVTVVILDYKGRKFPAKKILRDFTALRMLSGINPRDLKIVINKTHFAKITIKEWEKFDCDIYAGGNQEVNDHMTDLGIPVYEQERSLGYSARNYRKEKTMNGA